MSLPLFRPIDLIVNTPLQDYIKQELG